MKKILIKVIFIMIALSCIAFLSIKSYRKLETKRIAEATSMRLPVFSFYKQDGSLFTADSSSYDNEKIVINYFSLDCDHCQYMAKQIKKMAADFANITILMVTNADSLPVNQFAKKNGLENDPGIVFLRDPKYTFNRLFGSTVVPSFFLYKNRVLVKKITGETKVEHLVDF